MAVESSVQTFHGGCPHDCPDTCAMTYSVKDGRLIEVKGKAEHPMTRGGLCVKRKDFQDHHYHADRLLHPLKRHGPKGSRAFVHITWDQVLTEIRQRWRDIIDTYGTFLSVANVTDDVNPGIVVDALGYGRTLNPVGTVNSVAARRFGGMGHCPTFSDNLVEVENSL